MNTTRFLGTTLVGLMAAVTAAAQSGVTNSAPVLFETATLGELGDFGGYSIFNACFVGARFVINEPTIITAVGSHLNRYQGESFFGAVVALGSANAFPTGTPFSRYEVVAASTFELKEPYSSDYVFALPARLDPGHYGVVFGKGQFGDPSENGMVLMMLNNNSSAEAGPYFQWNGTKWEDSRVSNVRLVVYGSSAPVLQITPLTSKQLVLSWPAGFTNCVLETCPCLPPTADWTAVTNNCSQQGSRVVLTNSVDKASRFYRLRTR
jgi:hypothetical protein